MNNKDLFEQETLQNITFTVPEGLECKESSYGPFRLLSLPDAEILYSDCLLSLKYSNRCFDYLLEKNGVVVKNEYESYLGTYDNTEWNHESVFLYGKSHLLPRLTAWYGDEGSNYKYSGIHCNPNPWNSCLAHLKMVIESSLNTTFNSALLNLYRDGCDHLSWHCDNERELGSSPVIASVSFGATRDFIIRRIDDHSKKLSIPLAHGSVLVMKGDMQRYWEHSVPKRKKVSKARINVTFRKIFV